MPYIHQPIYPRYRHRYPTVRARVYHADDQRPKFAVVITQDDGHRRFAFAQGIIGDHKIQPHVRNCNVTIIDIDGRRHEFLFLFKNHRRLATNQAIESIMPGTCWKGDAALLRVAEKSSAVVNMRSGDAWLADFALTRCVENINAGRGERLKVPKRLVFHLLPALA